MPHPKNKHCLGCGTLIGSTNTRCQPCYHKYRRSQHENNLCPDCGKVIERTSQRCKRCWQLSKAHYCPDCGKPIYYRATRCRSCATINAHKKQGHRLFDPFPICADCGKPISKQATRCVPCNVKRAYREGKYDGVFKSPTSIELGVGAALDFLGWQHSSQYRPPGCRFVYDEYVLALNLLIEADGEYWHSLPRTKNRDKEKDEWADHHGYGLLRLWESDIMGGGAWVILHRKLESAYGVAYSPEGQYDKTKWALVPRG